MPLGFKLDEPSTRQAFALGRFKDKRSRVDTKGHDHLKGCDVEPFRRRIFQRSRGMCEMKNEDGIRCARIITWDNFEMHHDPDGYQRYDSMESCFAACHECHKRTHNREPQLRSIPL